MRSDLLLEAGQVQVFGGRVALLPEGVVGPWRFVVGLLKGVAVVECRVLAAPCSRKSLW